MVRSHLEEEYLQELLEGGVNQRSFCKFSSVGSATDSEIKAAEAAESRPSATICTILRFNKSSLDSFLGGRSDSRSLYSSHKISLSLNLEELSVCGLVPLHLLIKL